MAAVFVLITIKNSFLEHPLRGIFIAWHPCRVADHLCGRPPVSRLAFYGRQSPFVDD
jgi:hypothetical protein